MFFFSIAQVRYHHDGKYNVMSSAGPFEIYGSFSHFSIQFCTTLGLPDRHTVDQPAELTFESVRHSLMHIVPLCLDSDPSLIPIACQPDAILGEGDDDRDPDDFNFWSERQAKRICTVIKQAFGVEYAPEVVVADANLSALANRILASKDIPVG
jgi:phosphatidylethanolamine N-methyltransferase